MNHFTGRRIDGLEQPGGGPGRQVESRGDAQHESFASRKVEFSLKRAALIGDVNVDVAKLHIAEAERALVEGLVQLADDPQLADVGSRLARGRELQRIRQGFVGGNELPITLAQRTLERDLPVLRERVQELLQLERSGLLKRGLVRKVDAQFIRESNIDWERLEMG